jgi:hypothetical protein
MARGPPEPMTGLAAVTSGVAAENPKIPGTEGSTFVVATEIASVPHTTQNRSKEEQLTLIARNHTSSEMEAIICFAAGVLGKRNDFR